jgi:serine/threonine protein kinase
VVGTTVAHYEIVGKLGEGGMGVVYKARDTRLERFVAIKFLSSDQVADSERRARFVQEAKAASALSHPHIVTVHEISHHDGLDFIVMEFVDGRPLEELIARKALRHADVLRYAIQIADAMAAAHDVGIVHRDLKPGNVMVTSKGVVKVLDFGLAKLTGDRSPVTDEATRTIRVPSGAHTGEGIILGTVAYMSPEQAQGHPVDARSDIFNFGAVLYEMASGTRPFSGASSVSTLGAIIHKDPAPLGPDVPHDLQRVITRCLRKEPDRRYQSMKDVQLELQELKEESESGRLVESAAPVRPSSLRWGLLAGGLAVAIAGAAAGGWWWSRASAPPSNDVAPALVPLTSFHGLENSPSFSPDGNEVAFVWNGETGDNADIYVQLIGTGPPQRMTSDPAPDSAPAWSPDGRQIAFLRVVGPQQRVVMLMPSRGGPEVTLAEIAVPRDIVSTIAWHPDGRHLAVTDANALVLLSIESRQKARLTTTTPGPGMSYVEPAFSRDGRNVAFIEYRNLTTSLYVQPIDDSLAPVGEPRRREVEAPQFPVWTPDGDHIIVGGFSPPRVMWRVPASGAAAPERLRVGDGAFGPALSRDGRRLAFAVPTVDVNIWRLDVAPGGPMAPRLVPHIASTRNEQHPQFSPDGRRIAFQSARSGVNEVWVSNSDGTGLVQVTRLGGVAGGTPRWSPDGKQIAYDAREGGQSDIFIVGADGGTPRRLTTDPAEDFIPSWSRDGKWIYFESNRSGGEQGQVWKMPAAEGTAQGDAVQVTRNGGTGAFESHDGKVLYYWKWDGSIWQVPVDGGDETRVVDSMYRWFACYAVAEDGIYFLAAAGDEVRFYDFRTRQSRAVAPVAASPGPRGLAVSPDGRTILYTNRDAAGSDLMLVEDFR